MGAGFRPRALIEGGIMPKAKSLANVTFGATGEVYVKGQEYDVPAELIKKYPEYFKKMETAKANKQAATGENK
jgi:hypothetical protein